MEKWCNAFDELDKLPEGERAFILLTTLLSASFAEHLDPKQKEQFQRNYPELLDRIVELVQKTDQPTDQELQNIALVQDIYRQFRQLIDKS